MQKEMGLEQSDKALGVSPQSRDDLTETTPSDGKVMSLFDHLTELRSRLVRSMISILCVFAVAFTFADQLIILLKQPLVGVLPENASNLHFTSPMDVFIVQIKVGILVGIVAASPLWLYQFWKFFEPALYPRERKYILPFTFASASLFLLGSSFAFLVILPMALEFLIGIGLEVGTPIITIKDYLSMVMILIFGFGLVFETPVVLILLALLDLVSAESLSEHRQIVMVGILVVGALLTPPDPISQMAMALPVYLMFEMSIIAIRFIKKSESRASSESKDASGI